MITASTALLCVALTIFKEARGEPEAGKVQVGLVVLNRAKDDNISPCRVIKQKGQFSWYIGSLKYDPKAKGWDASYAAAQKAFTLQSNDTLNAKFFHVKSLKPRWTRGLVKVATIGNHIFYREKHVRNT